MARAYSVYDIAVINPVCECILANDAVAILSGDLKQILWATRSGASWLGYPDTASAVHKKPHLPSNVLGQLSTLSLLLKGSSQRTITLHVTSKPKGRLIVFEASMVVMPRGEHAVLIASPSTFSQKAMKDEFHAIKAHGQYAACLTVDGAVITASNGFDALKLDANRLKKLVTKTQRGEDVTRYWIAGAKTQLARMVQLTEAPPTYLLVIAEEPPRDVELSTEARNLKTTLSLKTAPQGSSSDAPVERALHKTGNSAPYHPKSCHALSSYTVLFPWRADTRDSFLALPEEAQTAEHIQTENARFGLHTCSDAVGTYHRDGILRQGTSSKPGPGYAPMWSMPTGGSSPSIDLASLPVYGRTTRFFEDFCGVGVARFAEPMIHSKGAETVLSSHPSFILEDFSLLSSSHKPSLPLTGSLGSDGMAASLEERETRLSPTERKAFQEIGLQLRTASQTKQPGAPASAPKNLASTKATNKKNDPSRQHTPCPLVQAPEGPGSSAGSPTRLDDPHSSCPESFLPSNPKLAAKPVNDNTQSSCETAQTGALSTIHERAPIIIDRPLEGQPGDNKSPTSSKNRPFLSVIPSKGLLHTTPAPFHPSRRSVDTTHILAHLPVPILIHSGDLLHYANKELLRLTGYEDLAQLDAAGGISALFDDPPPRAMQKEAALHLRTAKHSRIPVEARLQTIGWKGGRMAMMLSMRPIGPASASRTHPQELQESAPALQPQEMQAIIDKATAGIILVTKEGDIGWLNSSAAALFGYEATGLELRPFRTLFAVESQQTVQDYLSAAPSPCAQDGRYVLGRKADGRSQLLLLTLAPRVSEQGFLAVLRDVTQQKLAQEKDKDNSLKKSALLARTSHELRTPLNIVIGFSELMLDERFGSLGNERYREYLRDINRSGNHMLDLVNDLLDISKIEAGQQEMRCEAACLNEIVEQTVAMMQPLANRQRVVIRSGFASHLPEVIADAQSIRQITLNLLSNAIRYTPAGGRVIISISRQADQSVVLRIRDSGIGMNASELEEALNPFRQIQAPNRKRGDGTGLGLPLTRAMVEANRAQFSITSSPGEGTLVSITFPPACVVAKECSPLVSSRLASVKEELPS